MKYYKTHTLGCKVNTYETQAIKELLNKNGYEESLEDNPLCDVYIINTCAVTSIGEQKSRQKIRSAIKKHPGRQPANFRKKHKIRFGKRHFRKKLK